MLYNFRAVSFPSGEVTEHVGKLCSKSFHPKIRLCFVCVSCFTYMLSPGRVVRTLASYRCSPITPPLIRLGNNRLVECRLHGHAVLRVLNLCLVETLMLHIQVPVCLTYHLHVSMPVAQGSTRVLSTAVRLQLKETFVCLCSCTPARGYTSRLHLRGAGGERTAHNHICIYIYMMMTVSAPVPPGEPRCSPD